MQGCTRIVVEGAEGKGTENALLRDKEKSERLRPPRWHKLHDNAHRTTTSATPRAPEPIEACGRCALSPFFGEISLRSCLIEEGAHHLRGERGGKARS